MRKRTLSLALALVLCMGLLTIPAGAAGVTVTEVVPCKYEEGKGFSEGVVAVKSGGKWGLVDQTGSEDPVYQERFENNLRMREVWADRKYAWNDPTHYLDYDENLKALSDSITDGIKGDYEKLIAIHDWVCSNIYYDLDAYAYSKDGINVSFVGTDEEINERMNMDEYEILMKYKRGVCEYFSQIFQDLAQGQGIPCLLVSGTAAGDDHAWNEAYVDGRWIIIDTTFDTGNRYQAGKYYTEGFTRNYFDISIEEFSKDHRIEDYATSHADEHQVYKFGGSDHGFINWSHGRAVEGTTIRVNIFPDEGYQLSNLFAYAGMNAFGEGGYEVPFTQRIGENEDHSLYLQMPDDTLSLIAEFVPLEDCNFEEMSSVLNRIAPTAFPSTQTVTVDGKNVEFAMYALNGGSVNYIRVRDLAALLNGTAAQFEVGWDGKVELTAKTPYTGSADEAPFNTEMPYTVYTEPTVVNGSPVTLDAIQIQYDGGGYTYYKLRDLAQALGFNVGWSADKGVYVETDKPYGPNN